MNRIFHSASHIYTNLYCTSQILRGSNYSICYILFVYIHIVYFLFMYIIRAYDYRQICLASSSASSSYNSNIQSQPTPMYSVAMLWIISQWTRTPLFQYLVTQVEDVNSYSWILRVVLRSVTPIRPQNCVMQINKAPLVEAQKLQW